MAVHAVPGAMEGEHLRLASWTGATAACVLWLAAAAAAWTGPGAWRVLALVALTALGASLVKRSASEAGAWAGGLLLLAPLGDGPLRLLGTAWGVAAAIASGMALALLAASAWRARMPQPSSAKPA
jgi:hypothetical protein